MRKVKTIKKLSKYTGGGVVDLAEPIPTALNEPEQISKFRMDERKRIYQNYFNPQNNSTGLKNSIQHTVDDASQKAAIGFQLGGGYGAAAGALSSILLGELDNGGHVNADGSYELSSGFTRLLGVGRSDESIKREASRVRTSNIAMQQTANLQANYKNDPRVEVQPPVLAKDGGVISNTMWYEDDGEWGRLPDGTLYKEPEEGKPTDSNLVVGPNGTQILSDKQLYPGTKQTIAEHFEKSISKVKNYGNDKYAKNSQMLNDRYAQKQFDEHLMVQEAMKDMKEIKKLKNGIPAHEGGLNPYGFNDDITQFAYWDKDKNDYKKEYLDWVNSITEQDVKDIYSGVYGDMSTYLGKNKGYIPTVAEARRLMTDKKYGDWHKIGKNYVDSKSSQKRFELPSDLPLSKEMSIRMPNSYADPGKISKERIINDIIYLETQLNKPKKKGEDTNDFSWAENILDRIPLLAAYLNKPKYHIEEPQTWIPKFRPVAVDINPQRRAIDDSMAIARYNQANINPNTGAGMVYGLQAANNRAKQLADVYSYQTNAQNELIGQNVNIHNQWAPQMAAARYQAIADTRANEAAADAQRDMNIRDAMSYLRDEQIKPFLKQYLSSGAYNKSIKKLN